MSLIEHGVEIDGYMYRIRPCDEDTPGAEKVIISIAGELRTTAHTLSCLFLLPLEYEYVTITRDGTN
jgi:hypothetical protein